MYDNVKYRVHDVSYSINGNDWFTGSIDIEIFNSKIYDQYGNQTGELSSGKALYLSSIPRGIKPYQTLDLTLVFPTFESNNKLFQETKVLNITKYGEMFLINSERSEVGEVCSIQNK